MSLRVWGVAGLCAAAAVAHAQATPVGAERFVPQMDGPSLVFTQSAEIPPHLSWSVTGWGHLGHDLLLRRDSARGRTTGAVGWRLAGVTGGSLALYDVMVLGVAMPGTLAQAATDGTLAPVRNTLWDLMPVGTQDAALYGRVRVLRQDRHFFNLAVGARATLPTSLGQAWLGEDSPTLAPALLVSRRFAGLQLLANAGVWLRGTKTVGALPVRDEAQLRLGAMYDFSWHNPHVPLMPYAELAAATPLEPSVPSGLAELGSASAWRARQALEMGGGVRLGLLPGWQLWAGMMAGLAPAPGVPAWRVHVGLRFERPVLDRDGDGLRDTDDLCPDAAEDRDGYSDVDGCPDLDNDQDGVPDARDNCPLIAEDLDGFADQDGCPEEDNDGDGVLDPVDACPQQAGQPAANGCPEPDADGDGVVDRLDACPTQAPPAGQPWLDGCPHPDPDGDGVLGDQDACPFAAEDVDGFQDEDGCPELDRDGDGVPDALDGCPAVAGSPDWPDGCPPP